MPLLRTALFSFAVTSFALSGQWSGGTSERRAEIRGGGGDTGKCTIEVEVDGVAEVAINGDMGRLRTLSGNPASWRRFQCTSIMPGNPSDFRFKGIDGRGRQELINDPRGRGGALIRIDDPKGGSNGYTFDIEWRGTGGSGSGSGWGSGGSGSGSGWGGSGGSGGSGSGWGGSGGSGWAGGNEFSYSGRGSGTFNNANGNNDRLRSANVRINRNGNVEVGFDTDRNGLVTLRGRVTRSQSDRVEAAVSGNGIAGDMTIYTSGSNRVREIRMSGSNPVRFDLRWRE